MWTTPCLMLLLIAADPPASPEARFNAVFGQRIKEVEQTPTTDDDVELAKTLLEASGQLDNDPLLEEQFALTAFKLASSDPKAIELSMQALDLRAKANPEARDRIESDRIDFLQKSYTTARDQRDVVAPMLISALESECDRKLESDPTEAMASLRRALAIANATRSPDAQRLDARLRDIVEVVRWNRRIDQLNSQLAKDPTDATSAAELATLLITKLDDPERAGKYTFLLEEPLKHQVQAAARPVDASEPEVRLEMAQWYESLAGGEPATRRAPLYRRSLAFLDGYLAESSLDPLKKIQADVAQKRIQKALDALGDTGTKDDGKWIQLFGDNVGLAKWERFGPEGDPKVAGGVLSLEGQVIMLHGKTFKDYTLSLQVKPKAKGDIKVVLKNTDNGSFVAMITGKRMRWTEFNGKKWSDAFGEAAIEPGDDGYVDLEFTLKDAKIQVSVGGKVVGESESGTLGKLPGRVGVGVYRGSADFRNIRAKTLD